MKDYYQILGISKNASLDEIKKAFRKLAKKYHPDIEGGNEDKMKEISEAYNILVDENKRRRYDSSYRASKQSNTNMVADDLRKEYGDLVKENRTIIDNFSISKKERYIKDIEIFKSKLIRLLLKVNKELVSNLTNGEWYILKNIKNQISKCIREIDDFLSEINNLDSLYEKYETFIKELEYMNDYYIEKNTDIKILIQIYCSYKEKENRLKSRIRFLKTKSDFSKKYLESIDFKRVEKINKKLKDKIKKELEKIYLEIENIDFFKSFELDDKYIQTIIDKYDGINSDIYISNKIDKIKDKIKLLKEYRQDKKTYLKLMQEIDSIHIQIREFKQKINSRTDIDEDTQNNIEKKFKIIKKYSRHFNKKYCISINIEDIEKDIDELNTIIENKREIQTQINIEKLKEYIKEDRDYFQSIVEGKVDIKSAFAYIKRSLKDNIDIDYIETKSNNQELIELKKKIELERYFKNSIKTEEELEKTIKYSSEIKKIIDSTISFDKIKKQLEEEKESDDSPFIEWTILLCVIETFEKMMDKRKEKIKRITYLDNEARNNIHIIKTTIELLPDEIKNYIYIYYINEKDIENKVIYIEEYKYNMIYQTEEIIKLYTSLLSNEYDHFLEYYNDYLEYKTREELALFIQTKRLLKQAYLINNYYLSLNSIIFYYLIYNPKYQKENIDLGITKYIEILEKEREKYENIINTTKDEDSEYINQNENDKKTKKYYKKS